MIVIDNKLKCANNSVIIRLFHTCTFFNAKHADFVNSVRSIHHFGSSSTPKVQGLMTNKLNPNGWVSLILSNRECMSIRFSDGAFMNEGFVVNDEKVLKVYGNHHIGDI